jgi:hypothetical protein
MKTTKQDTVIETFTSGTLYKVGGVAALLAGILFRRNIAAEIGLFNQQTSPVDIRDWFALLQSNPLLGLSYLNLFDLVNYALLALMFLALYDVLKRVNKNHMSIATTLAFAGITIFFASNTAFSMLALSDRYAAATSEEQRTALVAAGQTLLAFNRFTSPGGHPGAWGYMSLLLIAVAGLIISVVMLRSSVFNWATAYAGILASGLDLAYCIAYPFVPETDSAQLAIYFIPAAGFFLMVWHILVGWRLYQLGRQGKMPAKQLETG